MTEFVRRLPARDLDPARLAQRRATAGLLAFVVVLALLIFAVETLSRIGVEQTVLIWLVATFALGIPALVAMVTPTIAHGQFAVAARNVSVAANAAATATALFGSVFAIGVGALFFRSEAEMSGLALGLAGGLLLSGALFAPYFRRSAAASLGSFLDVRFGRDACAMSSIIVVTALFPMLVAELSIAADIASWMFGSDGYVAMVVLAILMLVPPLISGIGGITAAGVLQCVLLSTALVGCSLWMSAYATGYALPIVGYVAAAARLETMKALVGELPASGMAAFALCIALGGAAMPTLMLRSAVAGSANESRSSIAWTLFFVAFFTIASASMAAIVRWVVFESPARFGSIAELVAQPWIVDWVARDAGFVALCGHTASQAGSACAAGSLQPGDLAIDPDIALLVAPEIAGVPTFFGMFIAVACIAASIGAGSLLIFGIGRAIGHDLLFRALMPRAPASRRLLIERLFLILAAAAAVRVAANPPADYLRLALASLSVAASGLFPVMLAAVWWPRANRFGALAGMIAGFAVALYLAAATIRDPTLFAWLEPVGLADLARALGIEKAALAAVPVGLFCIALVSMITPRPGAAQRRFANALHSPRDMTPDEAD
jgi:cation/acetate symporter